MKEIIVSADDSRRSLNAARVGIALATQMKLPLTLVSFVDEDESVSERRELLEQGLRELDETAANPTLDLRASGAVAEALKTLLDDREEALLCMATRGRGAVAEAALGSVASEVVQESRRAVVLTGPHLRRDWQGPIRTLMVCLDGSPVSEAILPQAVELSRRLDARLRLLHVLDPHASEAESVDVPDSAYLRGQAQSLREKHGIRADWEVLHGKHPAASVVDYSRAEPEAMIVMSTHGRSGLARIALGSVAHEIVHDADCPVVVLRPRRGTVA